MRLNRGTLVLLVAAIAVIVAVLVINNNQASAPGTPTATVGATGPLFPGVDDTAVVRMEVRDNLTGQRVLMTRSTTDAAWGVTVSEAEQGVDDFNAAIQIVDGDAPEVDVQQSNGESTTLPVDQTAVGAVLNSLSGLSANDTFETDDPAEFGLAQPAYSAFIQTADNAVYVMHIGSSNPNNTRYYVTVEQIADANPDAAGTAESTSVASSMEIGGASAPVLQSDTTAEAGATVEVTAAADATLEALATEAAEAILQGESTEAVSTLSAAVQATNAAVGDALEATAEANAANAANADATAESTSVASSMDVDGPSAPVLSSDMTGEATAAGDATAEIIQEAALTATVETTVEPVREPMVNLTGTLTVQLVPKTVVDGLIILIGTPPYIFPTSTPTPFPTANPYSEVDQTATAVIGQTATMQAFNDVMATITAQSVTAEATAAADRAATAEANSGGAATVEATAAP